MRRRKMEELVRYSEAFKLRLVEDVANGKYKSLEEARRRNGIRGGSTVRVWIQRYGREDILPKGIKVETMKEIDELQAARRREGFSTPRLWSGIPAARFPPGESARLVNGDTNRLYSYIPPEILKKALQPSVPCFSLAGAHPQVRGVYP
jgi:transposase-like protein